MFYLLILLVVLVYGGVAAYLFLMFGYASKGKDMALVTLAAIFWPVSVPYMHFRSLPKHSKK